MKKNQFLENHGVVSRSFSWLLLVYSLGVLSTAPGDFDGVQKEEETNLIIAEDVFKSTEECKNLSLLELELGIKSVIQNPNQTSTTKLDLKCSKYPNGSCKVVQNIYERSYCL